MFTQKEYFLVGMASMLGAVLVLWFTIALITKRKGSKWLLGTTNIRFYTKELIKMYFAAESSSVFGKKRIESGFAFLVMQWGLIHWLILNITTMGWAGMVAWASVEGVMCGYVINRIEKEKLTNGVT